jgi:hypothetical protein
MRRLPCWARISALRGCGEILGIETSVTGRGATNISAGALTVIQRSLKRSNCEAFEVSDLSDLSGGRGLSLPTLTKRGSAPCPFISIDRAQHCARLSRAALRKIILSRRREGAKHSRLAAIHRR